MSKMARRFTLVGVMFLHLGMVGLLVKDRNDRVLLTIPISVMFGLAWSGTFSGGEESNGSRETAERI